ncbi:hypothetical protein ACFQS2_04270 [Brachybacterium sp. GCM10030267]|uniref:hypothetical protein n=1 Tax=unclassified Brachybacterium TaxID=2623841 RepID=UPI00360724ED
MPRDARARSSAASDTGVSGPADAADPGPRTRPGAAVLLVVEALMLTGAATFCFVMVTAGQLQARLGTGLGLFLVLFAIACAVAARSVLTRGRFGLGFGLTWQMFQALVGASMLRSQMYWQGTLALVLAIALFMLLTRLVRSTPLPRGED